MKTTGRPRDENQKYTSKYLDIPNTPLYPFGYGLSYTRFEYSGLKTDKMEMTSGDTLNITVQLKNSGEREGTEVVQLYIRDVAACVTRPAKELKGFRRITLQPGEETTVRFSLTADDLKFYDRDMNLTTEPGTYRVFVGKNAEEVLETGFELK